MGVDAHGQHGQDDARLAASQSHQLAKTIAVATDARRHWRQRRSTDDAKQSVVVIVKRRRHNAFVVAVHLRVYLMLGSIIVMFWLKHCSIGERNADVRWTDDGCVITHVFSTVIVCRGRPSYTCTGTFVFLRQDLATNYAAQHR